jgi:hypothetical protein
MEIKFRLKSNNFQELLQKLVSKDDKMRMKSVKTIQVLTDQQVDWMYDAWDFLMEIERSEKYLKDYRKFLVDLQ